MQMRDTLRLEDLEISEDFKITLTQLLETVALTSLHLHLSFHWRFWICNTAIGQDLSDPEDRRFY